MDEHNQASITSARRYIDYLLASHPELKLPAIPTRCVISYTKAVTDQVKSRYRHRSFSLGFTNPIEVNFFFPKGGADSFAIARGLHGAPMAAVLLEELIALGFGEFLVIGPAGHPSTLANTDMGVGELLLPTEAWIYEGTSPHYGRSGRVSPHGFVVDQVRKCLHHLGIPCREGCVATTDALYRESRSFVKELVEKQALAVDMEMSALFSVADYYARPLGGLIFISDVVSTEGAWELGLCGERLDNLYHRLTDIVLEFVR